MRDRGRDGASGSGLDVKTRIDEGKLAELILRQALDKRSRRVGLYIPGEDPANVEYARVAGQVRGADGRQLGDLRSVLEYYQSISSQRLVIIGAPGAGKSVLLLELQIRLLQARREHPEIPVPVLVSASAYDTTKKWDDWLAAQISLEFSLRKRRASALVAAGRILPLVDGLDEMDPTGDGSPERARKLVQELNESTLGGECTPVVATCRPGEYEKITETVSGAMHVKLFALTGREAADFLNDRLPVAERGRWDRVLVELKRDPDGLLATELSTPWKLIQALAAYRLEGNPADLLPPEGAGQEEYSEHIDDILCQGYISSAFQLDLAGTPRSQRKVRSWLVSLAKGLQEQSGAGRSATDITLHEWRRPSDKWSAQAPFVAFMLLPFLVAADVGGHLNNFSVFFAALMSVFGLSVGGAYYPQTRQSRPESRRAKIMSVLGPALAAGVATGLTYGFSYRFMYSPNLGFKFELSAGIGFGAVAGLAAVLAGRTTNRIVIGIVTWLAFGVAGGLAYWLMGQYVFGGSAIVPIEFGLSIGITYGLIAGLVAGLTNWLTGFSPKARRPQDIIRGSRRRGFVGGVATGLAIAIASRFVNDALNGIGILFGDHSELPSTDMFTDVLAYGIALWFAISAPIWIRYHLSVTWNAIRKRGPLRFGKFLEWSVRVGLLRESGICYQFQHRELQDWLVRRSEGSGMLSRREKDHGNGVTTYISSRHPCFPVTNALSGTSR